MAVSSEKIRRSNWPPSKVLFRRRKIIVTLCVLDFDFYWGVFSIGILTRSVSSLKFWTRVPQTLWLTALMNHCCALLLGLHLQNPLPRAGETQGLTDLGWETLAGASIILLFIHFLSEALSHKPNT